ncbi:hypothetical protein [Natrinema saccharevitans]|nr:hypothetical protein [Natrinema saccharevitans]
MTNETPFKLEDRGEYDAAATAYARDGFEKCLESHFRMNGDTRVGITMLLQAISCDHRADNRGRAERLFQIAESLIADAESQAETEVLRGLLNEWRGDGRLMLCQREAIDHYRDAREQYETVTWQDLTWRDEPEFMHAYWAIERFSRVYDEPLPENPDSMSFQERIDAKLDLAADVLAETD